MVDCTRRALVRNAGLAASVGLSGCVTDSLVGEDGPERVDPDDELVDWKVAVDAPLRVRPAVGDAVYVAAGNPRADPESSDHTGPLAALAPADGTVQWRDQLPEPPGSPPVPRGGDCYLVTSGSSGMMGGAQRLRKYGSDGREAWRTEMIEFFVNLLGFGGGRAYLGTSDDALAPAGQPLYGVSLTDGTRAWEADSGDASRGQYHDGRLLVDAASTALSAHDPTDGSQQWMQEGRPIADGHDEVLVDGATAYVESQDGGVTSVDLADGTTGWTFEADDVSNFIASGGASDGDRLVVTEYDGHVFGLDPADGTDRWRFRADADVCQQPLLAGDRVFVGDASGTVYALDADTGEKLWQRTASGSLDSLERWDDALVVDASSKTVSELAVFEAGDGTERWRYETSAKLSRPAIGPNNVFVADETDGSVLAFS